MLIKNCIKLFHYEESFNKNPKKCINHLQVNIQVKTTEEKETVITGIGNCVGMLRNVSSRTLNLHSEKQQLITVTIYSHFTESLLNSRQAMQIKFKMQLRGMLNQFCGYVLPGKATTKTVAAWPSAPGSVPLRSTFNSTSTRTLRSVFMFPYGHFNILSNINLYFK